MTPLTEDQMHTWHITYHDDRPPADIRAMYPTTDDNLPGWVVFKNHEHKIVAMIPGGHAALIRRCVNQPRDIPGRLIGQVHATACLPPELDPQDDEAAARIEVALRTEVLAALMRDRTDSMGENGSEFYVYLDPDFSDCRRQGTILTLDYEDGDRFGPRLHVVLSGYEPGQPIGPTPVVTAAPGVQVRSATETSVAAGGGTGTLNWQALA